MNITLQLLFRYIHLFHPSLVQMLPTTLKKIENKRIMKNREPKMLQWFLTHKTTSEKHFNQHQGRKEKRINQHKGWKGRTLNSTNEKS